MGPWSGNEDPSFLVVQPKNKKKGKSLVTLSCSWWINGDENLIGEGLRGTCRREIGDSQFFQGVSTETGKTVIAGGDVESRNFNFFKRWVLF